MTAGKLISLFIVLSAVAAGAGLYYTQVHAFYEDVTEEIGGEVTLVPFASGQPKAILFDDLSAIDSESSPIRYRACFKTTENLALLSETYEPYDHAVPRVAPGWFECFDATAIAAELESGGALAFLGQKNIHFGVDRVVAITEDGRGYVWHDFNACTDALASHEAKDRDCPPTTN
ncbi:MAG: DUF6446 family protein [Marinovum sp.]|nr:DUF6446 family protein [Marinovum sp.]